MMLEGYTKDAITTLSSDVSFNGHDDPKLNLRLFVRCIVHDHQLRSSVVLFVVVLATSHCYCLLFVVVEWTTVGYHDDDDDDDAW